MFFCWRFDDFNPLISFVFVDEPSFFGVSFISTSLAIMLNLLYVLALNCYPFVSVIIPVKFKVNESVFLKALIWNLRVEDLLSAERFCIKCRRSACICGKSPSSLEIVCALPNTAWRLASEKLTILIICLPFYWKQPFMLMVLAPCIRGLSNLLHYLVRRSTCTPLF